MKRMMMDVGVASGLGWAGGGDHGIDVSVVEIKR